MENKIVKLLDNGKYLDIEIDFKNQIVIRLQDMQTARILRIEKNIIYVLGKNPEMQSVIVFDDKYAVCGTINKRNLFYNQPMNIWIGHKNKLIYYEVAKNACTSIASSIYTNNWKTLFSPKITEKRSVWDCLFWRNHKLKIKYLFINPVYRNNIHKYKDYTKFLVYDDPLDRFIRMMNNKHINHHAIASMIFPPYKKNIHDFIDQCILVTQLNCLNSYEWDQHLVPITQSGAMYIDDVTDFVYLKDIASFVKEKFGWTLGRHNAMPKERKPITRETLLPYQIEKIKEIYKKDYEIPIKYKDKFYTPNK